MTKILNPKNWLIVVTFLAFSTNFVKGQTSSSVLSEGNWYKVKIGGTGIYKVTYEFLRSIGYSVNDLHSDQIKLYGNSTGMLPFSNAAYRPDDLVENAILMFDGNDGLFQSGDYFLFYGKGADTWKYDSGSKLFKHTKHIYDDNAYFFLTKNDNTPLRATTVQQPSEAEVQTISTFQDYQFYEKDALNLIKSGRVMYGEIFDYVDAYDFNFSFPNLDTSNLVSIKLDLAVRSTPAASKIIAKANGTTLGQMGFQVQSGDYGYADRVDSTFRLKSKSDGISINLKLNKGSEGATGWLNFIELNATRKLSLNSNAIYFRSTSELGNNTVLKFNVSNASANCLALDITTATSPKIIEATVNGSTLSFKTKTDTLREYVVFNGSNFASPTFISKVTNQNLHGLANVNMIILTHPNFEAQANQLADLHRGEGLSVEVVFPEAVYNEFSSGARDVTGIKDFMKHLYKKAGGSPELQPKYLLLFGDGSYVNKDFSGNTNYLPTFQSEISESFTGSFVTDDYFGFLDPNESESTADKVDIGIGRLPASTPEQAQHMVDKIKNYISTGYEANGVSPFGNWRNKILFVADDLSGNPGENTQVNHFEEADGLAKRVDADHKPYLTDKIYLDAYKEISTPGGERYPDASNAFRNKVQQGALIVNYTGHGGEVGLAHERVLDIPTINAWTNKNALPFFVTATCEFSRFDDPARTSAGELILLNPKGGGIGLLSTTRVVFSAANEALNNFFYDYALPDSSGNSKTLGEITKLTKRAAANGSEHNHMNFMLLGDPAMRLAYPQYRIATTKINGQDVQSLTDTLKAFSNIKIEGEVRNLQGQKITSFNGVADLTVLDKPETLQTLGNDNPDYKRTFTLDDKVIYQGKSTITNGEFSFEFIVPKDISFAYGNGNLVYYATDGSNDANGGFKNIIVGGSSGNILIDNEGPAIRLFINNDQFSPGDFTDENPQLLAYLSDDIGINTTGNGIGHEILATLDGDAENAIVLNTFYKADLDTYTKGSVEYPFFNLEEGNHTLTLKVWDIDNNSSSSSINFVVANSNSLKVENLVNFPNPVIDETTFSFDHNQLGKDLEITVEIFDTQGKLIRTLQQSVNESSYASKTVKWDCSTSGGYTIERGMYVYRLTVKKDNGEEVSKMSRLLVLK